MWLFTSFGFVSIVQDRDNPHNLLVRARVADHLQSLFPKSQVLATPYADYRYRAIVNKKVVRKFLADPERRKDLVSFDVGHKC
jgi:hypothetical protein